MQQVSGIPAARAAEAFARMAPQARQLAVQGAGRGIERLVTRAGFSLHRQALDLLAPAPSRAIALLTGFPIRMPGGRITFENDGPLGAALLAHAFLAAGWSATLVCDRGAGAMIDALRASIRASSGGAPGRVLLARSARSVEVAHAALAARGTTHLIAIERPGAAADGNYYNMRAEPVSADIAPADRLVRNVAWRTAAYADGGNEIGMGNIGAARIAATIRHGRRIASRTRVDHLTLCGVSNWGAYGLLAFLATGLGRRRDNPFLASLDPRLDRALFAAAREAGAVDGVTRTPARSVDAIALGVHQDKLRAFRALALHHLD